MPSSATFIPAANLAEIIAGTTAVRDGMREVTDKIYQVSQVLVPVLTGALKQSGKVVMDGIVGHVVYDTRYAAYVEFGTSDTPAFAFLRRASDSVGDLT